MMLLYAFKINYHILLFFQVIIVHCGINNLPKDEGEVLFQKFMSLFNNIQKLNPRFV